MSDPQDQPASAPAWTMTYADMMSLLLCFFIVLFTMGQTEQQKFQALADSMTQQFGASEPRLKLYPEKHPTLKDRQDRWGQEDVDLGQEFQPSKTEHLRSLPERERLWMSRSGLTPSLGTVLLFEEQASTLTLEHERRLREAAPLFAGKANRIELRGHATGRPPEPGDTYRDDWDLSFARCYAVMQHLIEREGLERHRIRITVAGKNEPFYTGAVPELVVQNSRVEVFLLGEISPGAADTEGGER